MAKRSYFPVITSKNSSDSQNTTSRIQVCRDVFKWFFHHDHRLSLAANACVAIWLTGVRNTWARAVHTTYGIQSNQTAPKGRLFSPAALATQRVWPFGRRLRFSIVTPLYNTPEPFLRAMVQSVLDQTYPNWELCLADGSDSCHDYVQRICEGLAQKDRRIRYVRLQENRGISANTNACLELATGDYIGFLDHDDLLHPAALFEVARAIRSRGADLVYTDECTFVHTPNDARRVHFKPDFAPDTLRANNYLCHFTVVKKALLAGGLRSEFDGSQDFDLALRMTERTQRVAHIPEVLYYWREHEDSVAQSVSAKPYAVDAGELAVRRHLQRSGLAGDVRPVRSGVPIFRIRYELRQTPLVSVIICTWGNARELWACVRSVTRKTAYPNYEIVVVDCGTSSHRMLPGDRHIKGHLLQIAHLPRKTTYPRAVAHGICASTGEYALLLNPNLEVITPCWIEEMLMFAQRPDVGAVGAKLTSVGGSIRHAGLTLGAVEPVQSFFRELVVPDDNMGYMGRLSYVQNVSAVSASCMLVRSSTWEELGGLDEAFSATLADADLCLRMRRAGLLIVWTPFCELRCTQDSATNLLGHEEAWHGENPDIARMQQLQVARFRIRWRRELKQGDPYYNANFHIDKSDFTTQSLMRTHDAR